MLYIFKNFIKQYRLHLAFKHGVELIKKGRKEEAFNELNSLLQQEPYNPYIRNKLIILGEQLHKEVDLPMWEPSEKNDKKKFTLK